jgi:hypothetical protein
MAGYIAQFRYLHWSDKPVVVIGIASFLILQCVFAVIYRVFLITQKVAEPYTQIKEKHTHCSGRGGFRETSQFLEGQGFVSVEEQKKDRGGYLLMAKGLKRSRFIEVIAYCAIVLSLISGILNYGFRLRGNIEVATVGSLKDLDSVQLEKGFFSKL